MEQNDAFDVMYVHVSLLRAPHNARESHCRAEQQPLTPLS